MHILLSLFSILLSLYSTECRCSGPGAKDTPMRLVIIKGRAVQVDTISKRELPATTDTIMFQNTKCPSSFSAVRPDQNGNYQVMLSDGVYRLVVRDPASPDEDLLEKDQQRIVDTGSENSPNPTFELNIRIRAGS